jgi:hypothetical protein
MVELDLYQGGNWLGKNSGKGLLSGVAVISRTMAGLEISGCLGKKMPYLG